jgi:lysine-N-methylase
LAVIDEDDTPEDELWEDEAMILKTRALLFDILEDSERGLDQRVQAILEAVNAKIPAKSAAEWANVLSQLEILDPIWLEKLNSLRSASTFGTNSPLGVNFDDNFNRTSPLCTNLKGDSAILYPPRPENAFKNLIFYFLYRHVSAAEDEADLSARTAFAIFSYLLIRKLWEIDAGTSASPFETLCELCRMYSAEIEYSEDNTHILIKEMLQ